MNSFARRSLALGVVVVIVIAIGTHLRTRLGIDLDVESVRDFANGLGPLGPILFVGIVAGRGFLALPSQVVLIAAGLCFGTVIGTLVGGAGLMLSGLAIFFAVRYVGRHEVERRIGGRFGRILDALGHRSGTVALALGSAYPISPLTPIQAAAGLTPMRVSAFSVAALFGGLVRASTFAYFGNAIIETNYEAFVLAAVGLALILSIPLLFEQGRAWLRVVFNIGEADDSAATEGESEEEHEISESRDS